MCGIFGIVSNDESTLPVKDVEKLVNRLFLLSESRGKEASGLTLLPSSKSESLYVVRSPERASALVANRKFRDFFQSAFQKNSEQLSGFAFGHTRLVTNGSQLNDLNNQPVVYDGSVGVHNGIIVNAEELWQRHSDLQRKSDVDSEILVALLRKYYNETKSPVQAVRQLFSEVKGTATLVVTLTDLNILILATNNGSLYAATNRSNRPIYFASERYSLEQLLRSRLGMDFSGYAIKQVYPNEGLIINLQNGAEQSFQFVSNDAALPMPPIREKRRIEAITVGKSTGQHSVFEIKHTTVPTQFSSFIDKIDAGVKHLRRCTKCVLPETVPFIKFNSDGVCNFCSNYQKIQLLGRPALEKELDPYRKPGKEAEVVCALSGGRDSCWGIHYLVKELGIRPVAYTYDWGMITDLARRNISRMCSALGVENILISANIPYKRRNIKLNVEAWLRKPHLGMIPLFMAGDKQFVWYGHRVKKQTGLSLDVFTFNLMEKAQFKEEYTGIEFWKPGADSNKLGEELGIYRGAKLCAFYGKEFLTNPAYLNRTLFDTFYGFVTYYVMPQSFVAMFRYLEWREDTIVNTLLDEYDWELATDTESTWRIGDGTAPFYNYIYYVGGGFTENDTLRSNQIREGQLTREEALRLTERDNRPRWDSIKWYCDIVGLDFERTIDTINKMPKQHTALEVI